MITDIGKKLTVAFLSVLLHKDTALSLLGELGIDGAEHLQKDHRLDARCGLAKHVKQLLQAQGESGGCISWSSGEAIRKLSSMNVAADRPTLEGRTAVLG